MACSTHEQGNYSKMIKPDRLTSLDAESRRLEEWFLLLGELSSKAGAAGSVGQDPQDRDRR